MDTCRNGTFFKQIQFFLLQVFLFANSKCKRYFHNRLKPAKLTWTAMYRKQHKKVSIAAKTYVCTLALSFSYSMDSTTSCC
jgi:hypothetical protein